MLPAIIPLICLQRLLWSFANNVLSAGKYFLILKLIVKFELGYIFDDVKFHDYFHVTLCYQ